MRGPTPVGRFDDEALASQFGFQRDIVEIAADGQLAVSIRADKALNQSRGIGAAPIGKLRGGNFGIADAPDLITADWFEQAARSQVADDHIADLAAQFPRVAGWRVNALRGWQAGNGYDQLFRCAIVDIDGQLGLRRCGQCETEGKAKEQGSNMRNG